MVAVADGLERVRGRVAAACARANRDPTEVELLAITKTVGPARISEAYAAGQRDFGENYVQECLGKVGPLSTLVGLRWSFVGHLQRNKAARVVEFASRVQSVDRLELAVALDRAAAAKGRVLPILIQVAIGGEETKSGVDAASLPDLFDGIEALPNVRVDGLMSIPPPRKDPEQSRLDHRALRTLRDRLEDRARRPLPVLSMGMSGDLDVAIEEGATQVRVGTAIFGERRRG